jgi:hypothetical protein
MIYVIERVYKSVNSWVKLLPFWINANSLLEDKDKLVYRLLIRKRYRRSLSNDWSYDLLIKGLQLS